MNRYRSQKNILMLTALALVLGFFIVGVANAQRVQEKAADQENQRLIAYIEEMEAESLLLQQRIQETREQIDAIQTSQAEGESLLANLNQRLSQLSQAAGMTQLTGPGIIITLDDNKVGAELAQKNNPATYNAENFIVHDKDILYLVRAMAGHAEALSINGIRIVDTTSIRCMGSVVMVNSARLAPPYEIHAIGNPQKLAEAVQHSGRYHRLQYMSIPISITSSDEIHMPAYSGSLSPNYSSILAQ